MCGIAGILSSTPPELDLARRMSLSIAHRGPDDDDIFSDHHVALIHRRLAIVDTSSLGKQPMHSADGRHIIVFNGEIYNHADLRPALARKYPFRSQSDTETLLYGFIEHGPALLEKLNGIFAFAVYDTLNGEVFIARDQLGVKPLYFASDRNTFLFSSEIKALTEWPGLNKALDVSALGHYLTYLWNPGNSTPFMGVQKLLPGHWLRLNTQQPSDVEIKKYYEIPFDGVRFDKTERQLTDELDERLHRAVERQLMSDVPLGFFLSGGLDSSAVVACARNLWPQRDLPCYTIRSNNASANDGFADDLPYARKVAAHLRADLRVIEQSPDYLSEFDRMIYHLDEPQGDIAPLNVLHICAQARAEGCKVLLGGTAGDDLFSGYRRHQALRMEALYRFLPQAFFHAARFFFQKTNTQNTGARRLQKLLRDFDRPIVERLAAYYAWRPMEQITALFSKKMRSELEGFDPLEALESSLQNIPLEQEPLNWMLYWDQKFFLPDHNLNYTDKLSMAVGVEARVPFLDLELVAFAAHLPVSLKLHGTTTKYLLKKVMERYLPHEIIYRPKTGFGAPVRQWVRGAWQQHIHQTLSPAHILEQGIFDPEAVTKLISDNQSGRLDASYTVLSLLSIESWARQFLSSRI